MKIFDKHSRTVQEHANHIRLSDVRETFWYLVGFSECLAEYQPEPVLKGVIRDYRFLRDGENWFAFIVNRTSLLFYIRAPATRSGKWTKQELLNTFEEVKEPRIGEITIQISSVEAARKLMSLVF